MNFSRISLVFAVQISSENSEWFPWVRASNNGGVGKQAISYESPKLLLLTIAYALSISTKINDFEWPWTAKNSNFRKISRDFADMGGNNS